MSQLVPFLTEDPLPPSRNLTEWLRGALVVMQFAVAIGLSIINIS